MRSILISSTLLLLAACGGGAPEQPAAPAIPQEPSEFQNQVAALTDSERNGVFIRAIRDAGKPCQGVTESKLSPDKWNGGPLWLARCNDGVWYGVALGREGTAQIVSRAR